MKKSLLASLKGIKSSKARQIAESDGHLVMEIPVGVALASAAYPNTVVLWVEDDDTVREATAGDPLELE